MELMYFCIICRDLHKKTDSERIFTTGFHQLQNGQEFPLGLCMQEREQSLKAKSKAEKLKIAN